MLPVLGPHYEYDFFPVGLAPDHDSIVIHTVGLRFREWHNYPHVLSPYWRCYYNRQPGHGIGLGGRDYPLGPDAITLIPDHQTFSTRGGPPAVSHFWIHFSVGRRVDPRQPLPIRLAPGPVERGLLDTLRELIEEAQAPDRLFRVAQLSQALLHTLLSRAEIAWEQGPSPTAFLRARERLRTRFAERVRIAEVAREAGLSERSLSAAFRRHQGSTAAEFLRQVRVREAATRLERTEETLDAIAEATGFPNRFHLGRVFKKVTGIPPAHYRRLLPRQIHV